MLVENYFPQDTRVANEASLLSDAGYQVTVIALRRHDQKRHEALNGVDVYRVPTLELFNKTSSANTSRMKRLLLKLKAFVGYTVEYCYFTMACLVVSGYIFVSRGFDVIHGHNPPDTLFLVALPFKLLGKKFVFDQHDLRNGPDQMRMAPVAPSARLRGMNKHILCYIGSLNPQDGIDYLLRSLRHLLHDLKRSDFHCVIMGTGDSLQDLRDLAEKLQLNGCVDLAGFVSDEDLQANLAAADICVDPDPSSPLNDVSTWIKVMEYMAYAKPIVAFDLKETRFSAGEAAIYVQPNKEAEFAQAIVELMEQPELRKKMGAHGRRRVEQELQWNKVGRNLLKAYETLLGKA